MTHPYLAALGVGYLLKESGLNLQVLIDEMFGEPERVDQPPAVELPEEEDVQVIEEVPPIEAPPEAAEVLPPPFEDPFKPDLEIPPELVGPIPEEVLEAAREKYGPSSELGPLGLESPFLEAEEAIPGFVAPPLEVFVRTILPPVRRAPTLQALIRQPSLSRATTIAPTVSPTISPQTLARTQLRGQFTTPSLLGLRIS